jgi:choline dehydrogenase-like flavoprotein
MSLRRTEYVDVCVIGSGAGGSVIAYEAAKRGLRTLIVERGPYVRSHEMTHDECEMFSRLYKDGALQMNASMDMFILQGSAVGGSTVLANMVMFRTPEKVLDAWEAAGASLDRSALARSFVEIERALGVTDKHAPSNVSPSSRYLMQGAKDVGMGLEPRWMPKAVGRDCVGCGGCNLGCVFGTKRSALTTYIPWAEDEGARVFADTTIDRIEWSRGRRRVTALHATRTTTGERLRIVANQVVVACGAIGSPGLLLKSGLGSVVPNVGRRASFNVGALLLVEYEEPIDDFDGDQMTAYAAGPGYTIEPVHQGPMTTALSTPGWFAEHAALMQRYRHLTFATALVPTQPVGEVIHSRWFGHEETRFEMPATDLATLRRGLAMTAKVYFAAGAKRVYLPTQEMHAIDRADRACATIEKVMVTPKRFNMGSAHPQGGVPLGGDRSVGAIDKDFALHGFENLFVCDASVFPTSVGVNPIETIMALADYAAPRILARA